AKGGTAAATARALAAASTAWGRSPSTPSPSSATTTPPPATTTSSRSRPQVPPGWRKGQNNTRSRAWPKVGWLAVAPGRRCLRVPAGDQAAVGAGDDQQFRVKKERSNALRSPGGGRTGDAEADVVVAVAGAGPEAAGGAAVPAVEAPGAAAQD